MFECTLLSMKGFYSVNFWAFLRLWRLLSWPVINLKLALGPLSIKEWDAVEKHGKIGPYLAELVFWLSCKISFFTIYNHTITDQDSRLETFLWGRNIVLIWGITKPFQQNEVPCYTCKEFRALKANVYFRVAYSLNIQQGTSFSGRVWW